MSYRLYVAKVHRIEFGRDFFNHESIAVNKFLQDIALETGNLDGFFYNGDDDVIYSDHLEIDKDKWEEMISVVEKKPDGPLLDNEYDHAYTKEEVLRFMRGVLEDADPDNSTIHLYWF